MTFKVIRNALGDVVSFGPDDEHYDPVVSQGGALTVEQDVPIVTTDPNDIINAQIKALLDEYAGNRGSLQMEVYLLEKEAREYSDIYGLPMELILSGNTYYPKVKAQDVAITALIGQLV
jgi:hypothetical protein